MTEINSGIDNAMTTADGVDEKKTEFVPFLTIRTNLTLKSEMM
jgi:hypothetical protein